MSDLVWFMAAFLATMLVYRFRKPILARLARFDAQNAQRKAQEILDRRDRFAHYRRTVLTAEECLEEVKSVTIRDERTGEPVTRYLFLGETFSIRNEAETARRMRAVAIAREFYAELDGATLTRRPTHEPTAPTAPATLSGPDKITPPRPS